MRFVFQVANANPCNNPDGKSAIYMAVKRRRMLVPSSVSFGRPFLNDCSPCVSEAEMMDRGDRCETDGVFMFAVTGPVW